MGWTAQYDATYASAKLGDVEGDEQAEMESGGFEIGEHLGHVDGSEGLYGLELHDERAIDEQVDPAFSNGDPLVLYGDGSLTTVGNAAQPELHGKRFLVDGFQKSGSESPVHIKGGINDLRCQGVEVVTGFFSRAVHSLPSDSRCLSCVSRSDAVANPRASSHGPASALPCVGLGQSRWQKGHRGSQRAMA